MKIISLNCENCGAPLEVPAKVRFVTCRYCESKLAVRRRGSAAYTEILESIDEKTDRMAGDLETIKLQNQIELLDREWAAERDGYLRHNKDGSRSVPTVAGSLLGGLVAAGFGVFWITQASSMGAPAPFPLFGILFVAIALVVAVSGTAKARKHVEARRRYEARRVALVSEMHDREKRRGPTTTLEKDSPR